MAKKKTTSTGKRPKPSQAKTKKPTPKPAEGLSGPQRLQRVMASAGVGSRRECEVIIEEGRVEVDGQIVVTLGSKVDPQTQKITVDGERLKVQRLQYFMLNKPPGIVSTASDPAGRLRVIDLIKTNLRVYNVGRLDQSSEGMILVTNDGELANRLTHPRYGINKKYLVQVDGVPSRVALRQLEEGMYLAAEGKHKAVKAKAVQVKFVKTQKSTTWLEIILDEGRNREIRRLLARIGHKVRTLRRVAIGPLKLDDLPIGAHRPLTFAERKALRQAVEGGPQKKKPRKKKPTKKAAASADKATGSRAKPKSGRGASEAAPTPEAPRRKGTVISPGKKRKPKKDTKRKSKAKNSTSKKSNKPATKKSSKKSAKKKKAKRKTTGVGRRGAAAGVPLKKKKVKKAAKRKKR